MTGHTEQGKDYTYENLARRNAQGASDGERCVPFVASDHTAQQAARLQRGDRDRSFWSGDSKATMKRAISLLKSGNAYLRHLIESVIPMTAQRWPFTAKYTTIFPAVRRLSLTRTTSSLSAT